MDQARVRWVLGRRRGHATLCFRLGPKLIFALIGSIFSSICPILWSVGQAQAGEARLLYSEIALLVSSELHELIVSCDREALADPRCGAAGKIAVGVARDGEQAGAMLAFDAPAVSLLGGRYALRPSRPFTATVDAKATAGGLNLTIVAGDGVLFTAVCVSAPCVDAALLPAIAWKSAHVSVRFGPENSGKPTTGARDVVGPAVGKPLQILNVEISGRIELECLQGWGVALLVCAATRAAIGPDVRQHFQAAIEAMRVRINTRGIAFLILSGAGLKAAQRSADRAWRLLRINKLDGDARGVRISFCFWPECA